MASTVTQIVSVIRASQVRELYVEYNIPKSIVFTMPDEGDRVCFPPEGCITLYEAHLRSGLHLPILDELLDILTALQIPIARLHANAERVPEIHTERPIDEEIAVVEPLLELVEGHRSEFQRDHLVSLEEANAVLALPQPEHLVVLSESPVEPSAEWVAGLPEEPVAEEFLEVPTIRDPQEAVGTSVVLTEEPSIGDPAEAVDSTKELPKESMAEATIGSVSSPPSPVPRSHNRSMRPECKVWQEEKIIGAVSKGLRQRDLVISIHDREITWLEKEMELLKVEHLDDTAVFQTVMLSLKEENIGQKEENGRLRGEANLAMRRIDQLSG
ncbi:hypothetical protein Nepgr_033293 [Nepenthes gracilis]|uniref:Uncharacterized protein n=1 Tax=Nepenthes gracilis TaxID=150966 RepID=A0AAD3TKY6_NEPGR|nr:hypothetical protein Nepgr_033293 [Nepenthes gracilis]